MMWAAAEVRERIAATAPAARIEGQRVIVVTAMKARGERVDPDPFGLLRIAPRLLDLADHR